MAQPEDCDTIARLLWSVWWHLQSKQMSSPKRNYDTVASVSNMVCQSLCQWLVWESPITAKVGYFSIREIGKDKAFTRLRFRDTTVQIEQFNCLEDGETLADQFRDLRQYMGDRSILLCIPTQHRDAYWAAMKSGFKLLGESPTIVGTFAWLLSDCDHCFETVQAKLRSSRILPKQARKS